MDVAVRRLLIVDDEPAVLDLLKRYLERLGHSVEITASAEAALELFEAAPERYDLVITDLKLPGMGGEDLLKRMRDRKPSLRALISSGYPHRPSLPNVGFLLKPYLPDMMIESIERMFN
jgi:DNA-binding NtrC family response regulator